MNPLSLLARYLRWDMRAAWLQTAPRLLTLFGLIAVALAVAAPLADAAPLRPDSDAPPGATWAWLPAEDWVMERWLPFDEARLQAILDVDESAVHAYVLRSGRTLNQLAKRQGVPTKGLARRLVAPRRKTTSQAGWATLRRRTARVLSQSHLSEHMLDHHFHTWSVFRHTNEIFGVAQARFDVLANRGQSMGEIAADGGITALELRRRMIQAVDRTGKRGIRLGAMTKRQNRRLRARGRGHDFTWVLNYRLPVVLRVQSIRSSAAGAPAGGDLRLCALGSAQR